MKIAELQIGDWIHIEDESWGVNLNARVREIEKNDEDYGVIVNKRGLVFFDDTVTPIPLSAEILEKNGFVKHDKMHPYYMDYYHERDGFTIFNSRTWYGHILNSVHELQHALRLCGLNDLANNLKIE